MRITRGDKGAVVKCHANCETSAVVERLGLTMADLFDEAKRNGHREIVATYRYVDEGGNALFEVVRFHPKSFRQRKPDGTWSLNGVRRVLYRLGREYLHR